MLIFIKLIKPSYKSLLIWLVGVPLAIILVFSVLNMTGISDSVAFRKYQYTLRGFTDYFSNQNKDLSSLDKYTGARLSEANSALKEVSTIDMFFGKGSGYTFTHEIYGDKVEGYANVHFTPLSIYIYYGLFFAFFFYLLFFKSFWISIFYTGNETIVGEFFYITLYFFIASIFSYLIFNSLILPMALGVILSYNKPKLLN